MNCLVFFGCYLTPAFPQERPISAERWRVHAVWAALQLPDITALYEKQQEKPAERWQVNGIAAALEDPLPSVRLRALQRISHNLQGLPASSIVPLLQDPALRPDAISALGVLGAMDMTKLLKDPDANVRSNAVRVLARLPNKDCVGAIAELLRDPDPIVRSAAALALAKLQAKDHAGEIAKLLRDRSEVARFAAVSALGRLQVKDEAAEIVRLLSDRTPYVRSFAALALAKLQAKDHAGEIAKLLRDPDGDVRGWTILALGELQAKDHVREIVIFLGDPRPDARTNAASALGAMQAKEYVREIANLLRDPDPNVRSSATQALGSLQAKDHATEILRLLSDPYPDVRQRAVYALAALQGPDHAGMVKLLKAPEPEIRGAAARILGIVHATGQVEEIAKLLTDEDPDAVIGAVSALAALHARDQTGEIAKLLENDDWSSHREVRVAALSALGSLQAKDQAGKVIQLLRDQDWVVRATAGNVLEQLSPFPPSILTRLSEAYYFNHAAQIEIRWLCYYVTGGDRSVKLVLQRILLEPDQKPGQFGSVEEARAALRAFHELLPQTWTGSPIASDAEEQILQIIREWNGKWTSADRQLFWSLSRQISSDNAASLRGLIETPWWQTAFDKFWKIVAAQIFFWILLLYFYPSSTQVQAFFFWNRWARKFLGLGYVDLCLTWIPVLRNRLLAPFREELVADAQAEDLSLGKYFEDVLVQEGERQSRPSEAIAEVVGQIVLEGESGLGKSMFLRRLVKNTKDPIAYLPADSCDHGVFELIQRRLKGKAGDDAFLKSIIWSGGLRIIIDGLNEVTVETREKVRRFLDDFPKAHVLLATQPMLWKRPPKARVLRLLKLSDERIMSFLASRYASFTPEVAISSEEYAAKCRAYLDDVLGQAEREEDRSAARLTLSNPMDLSTVAQILVSGDRPTLKNLQEQQFGRVSREFRDTHPGDEFPISRFSESVYQRLLRDETVLDGTQFLEAIQAMVKHKMALEQYSVNAEGKPARKWVFRHEKVRDYFLMQAFLAQADERILKHLDDPRFRGVYLMLASQLPLEQARELRDAVVDRAAETKDHHLSDAVVEVLRMRKVVSALTA